MGEWGVVWGSEEWYGGSEEWYGGVKSGMEDWGVVYRGSEEWYGGVFTWKTLPIKGCPTH